MVPEIENHYPNGKDCDEWPCQTTEKTITMQ